MCFCTTMAVACLGLPSDSYPFSFHDTATSTKEQRASPFQPGPGGMFMPWTQANTGSGVILSLKESSAMCGLTAVKCVLGSCPPRVPLDTMGTVPQRPGRLGTAPAPPPCHSSGSGLWKAGRQKRLCVWKALHHQSAFYGENS